MPHELRILYVVDDDESVGKGLSRLLRASGFEVRLFASPERFLDEVRDELGACIILDITMPGMTGLQVQARLLEKGIGLPVVAVSARDDEHARRSARELGARFFLRKPVDAQALLDAIAWVTSPEQDGAVKEKGGAAAGSPPVIKSPTAPR